MVRQLPDGGRKQRVSDDDILDVIRGASDPVLSTAEVAEQLPIKRRGTLNRLQALREEGALGSKAIGGRNTVWWIAGRTEPRDGQQRPEGSIGSDHPPGAPEADARRSLAETDPLATIDFPAGRDRRACEAAIYAARDHIQEHGRAFKREIVTDVMPEHPIGYDVPELESGDRYRGAWWRKVVRPGLDVLDDVEKPAAGGGAWSYSGDGDGDPDA